MQVHDIDTPPLCFPHIFLFFPPPFLSSFLTLSLSPFQNSSFLRSFLLPHFDLPYAAFFYAGLAYSVLYISRRITLMGKYMRKAKISGEVAVMELSHGVRTRARTLAAAAASCAYLELRSRRLEKPLPLPPACKAFPEPSPSPGLRASSGSAGSFSTRRCSLDNEAPPDAQASFGENILEVEATDSYFAHLMVELLRKQSTLVLVHASSSVIAVSDVSVVFRNKRETTPCSLIRNPEEIQTPGSTNRPTRSRATNRRIQTFRQNLPNAHEMEEFFSREEQLQQRIFIERYNFDPANDHPLPGRYEWVKIDF
ncbi:hypothetical protein ZIOFF_062641 [Zingiber officinale]|uniref:Cyclin-dependent kinase inhibitor domain-containing protein n=1 Tax=Zingiber officinale TaxID=94328 RepID=A0A8J5F0N4_ZINOF|nr:hypothetical protein ZIOFF_062639 [Zingiber officinale]KAG6479180.1 hypothetical protein ZIOFF_062641 [Zingiber officinale]